VIKPEADRSQYLLLSEVAGHGKPSASNLHLHDGACVAGRYHQLRRHLASIGYPILGDRRYTYGYARLRKAKLEAEGKNLAAESSQAWSWAEAWPEHDNVTHNEEDLRLQDDAGVNDDCSSDEVSAAKVQQL
jgi:hypothetical protein